MMALVLPIIGSLSIFPKTISWNLEIRIESKGKFLVTTSKMVSLVSIPSVGGIKPFPISVFVILVQDAIITKAIRPNRNFLFTQLKII